MAPSTIRKAIGAVKDQTSIGLAKVSSNLAPDLDVAIVKATSHDDDPAEERHIREILTLTSYSRGYVTACVATISRRLGKTRDWIVALKALMLIHRLLSDGDLAFQQEIVYATRRGARLLNMSDFRDEAHSSSWDHSAFVRTYALYLDQRLEFLVFERKQGEVESRRDRDSDSDPYGEKNFRSFDDDRDRRPPRSATPLREMKTEGVLGKMHHLQQMLERFLACRPAGTAKSNRMILIALYPAVRESFQLYADVCEALAILLDRFFEMEYAECVKAFDVYARAAKQIDELAAFYGWCKDTGVARSSEYPEIQKITDKLLETLEEFVRDRAKRMKSPERQDDRRAPVAEEPIVEDMNQIKALPAPESFTQPSHSEVKIETPRKQATGDLVDLREETTTADDQGNKLAIALFAGGTSNATTNGKWEAFDGGQGEVSSAWQTPAAESGKADWELALVESASNLSKEKAAMAGGLDPLLLNGMYDQGIVSQHTSMQMSAGGSASSVALAGPGKSRSPVLALPAPDGTIHTVAQDPFEASMAFPPPSYVQMSDMEKKQQLLVQEQLLWQQYQKDGMHGQVGLAKVAQPGYHVPSIPHGMPTPSITGSGYYYAPF